MNYDHLPAKGATRADEERSNLVESVYTSVNQISNLPHGQAKVDELADRFGSVKDAGPFRFLNDFYTANQATIQATVGALSGSMDKKGLENAINTFGETTKVVLKGLDNLEKLHPVVGAAVLAFKLVVTLDLTRRENNRKVVALKIEMQSMISALFELRHISDPEDKGPDGTPLRERLGGLIDKIAKDIRECGSACDVYMKKGFLAKTIKSTIYEGRLAAYSDLFTDDRAALERALTVHTTIGVENANRKLDAIEEKLDMLLIFKKFSTPRELDVQMFLERNGGAKACIEDDGLLSELISKSGERTVEISGRTARGGEQDLGAARKTLMKELSENVDEVIKENLSLFEQKLEIQNKRLEDAITQQGSTIIEAIFSGSYERIVNEDVRTIWQEMGWKGHVKARQFVLALHDYFHEKRETRRLRNAQLDSTQDTHPPVDDTWALRYVNLGHIQPIIEAIDDDGTGFISVQEANTFTNSCPPDWTLLQWLAFWAEGWRVTVSNYQERIITLMRKMFNSLVDLLPPNRRMFNELLGSRGFQRIERLLRSTRSMVPRAYLFDSDLLAIAEQYKTAEEARLKAGLVSVDFTLDAPSTVALVTGPGRIERYIYPLLYILIKHQLRWFTLGCHHVLDQSELDCHDRTMSSLMSAVGERAESLQSILKQSGPDVQARLKNVAFGMLQLLADHPVVPNDLDLSRDIFSIRPQFYVANDEQEIDVPTWKEAVLSDLKYNLVDFFNTDVFQTGPVVTEQSQENHPISGVWAGHCALPNFKRLMEFSIHATTPHSTAGVGVAHHFDGLLKVTVAIEKTEATTLKVLISFRQSDINGKFECVGVFDSESQKISGICLPWKFETHVYDICDEEQSSADAAISPIMGGKSFLEAWSKANSSPTGAYFNFTRTPIDLQRFRPDLESEKFVQNPSRSRWSFACHAVLYQIRKKACSWTSLLSMMTERKNYMRLREKVRWDDDGVREAMEALATLRGVVTPTFARLWESLSKFDYSRTEWQLCRGCFKGCTTYLACIVCWNETSGDGGPRVNLCVDCKDFEEPAFEDFEEPAFEHNSTHTLMKVNNVLHSLDRYRLLQVALELASLTRTRLRESPSTALSSSTGFAGESLLCAWCSKGLSSPCWACVQCGFGFHLCPECEEKKPFVPRPLPYGDPSFYHFDHHPLIFIRDTSVAISREARTPLERRIEGFQSDIALQVADGNALLKGIQERLDNMEVRMENIERCMEERLVNVTQRMAGVEALLLQIASVLNVDVNTKDVDEK